MTPRDATVFQPPGGRRVRLEITLPGGEISDFALAEGRTLVGRDESCDLVLPHATVSRRHASLEMNRGVLTIRDLGSSNGVKFKGRDVSSLELGDGDQVLLGNCVLTVRLEQTTPQPEDEAGRTRLQGLPTSRGRNRRGDGGRGPARGKPPRPAKGADKGRRTARVILAVLVPLVGGLIFLAVSQRLPNRNVADQPPEPPPAATQVRPGPLPPPAAGKPSARPGPKDRGRAQGEREASSQRYLELGQSFYESGKLSEAIAHWQRAVEQNPQNRLAQIRLQNARDELSTKASEAFNRGLRAYKYLDYNLAVENWQYVLNLVPDPDNELHRQALEHLRKAREQMRR